VTTLEAAQGYIGRGMIVIPLQQREKKPIVEGWPQLRLKAPDLPRYFGNGTNIGVLLGDHHGTADVDLDCYECIAAGLDLLPRTSMVFGRQSKPISHYFYRTDPAIRTKKYLDPLDKKKGLIELRGLKSDGTVGLQTMVPPSTHPSGEVVRFVDGFDKTPANVDATILESAVARVAAAAALARYFPDEKGGRNLAFLALAGAAARAGWTLERAVAFHRALYRILWGHSADFDQAKAEVKATFDEHAAGSPVTARTSLEGLINARVVREAFQWLGWSTQTLTSSAAITTPREPDIIAPPATLAFPENAWRGAFDTYRKAQRGSTEASDVVHFSVLWTAAPLHMGRRVSMSYGDILYPNTYICFSGPSGDKKTTAQRRIQRLLPQGVPVFTVGSVEGLSDELSQHQKEHGIATYLFRWEELASFLCPAKMKGSPLLPFLTEVFDCPAEFSRKYRHNKIDVKEPTPSVHTCTTPDWFWRYATPDDFFGGAMNRFLFLSGPKKAAISKPTPPDQELLNEVVEALRALDQIQILRLDLTPEAEKLWDQFYRDFYSREREGLLVEAPQRIHVYVLKLSMVYAALEGSHDIDVPQLKAAIAVGEYAAECTRRLLEERHVSRKVDLDARFLEYVTKHEGKSLRDLQQELWRYANAETFSRVLKGLLQADRIEIRMELGRKRVYLAR
jgi:hypothetical protein